MQPTVEPAAVGDLLALVPLPEPERRDALRQGVVPKEVSGPARQLVTCWERSRSLGACPDGANALEHAVADPSELQSARERTQSIWNEAHPLLEDFAATCARRDYVTLLCDPSGIVTHAVGGGGFQDEARRLRLIEGATWGEALRGTNAIGTALAEGRPTAVLGPAHFARVNEGLVCVAAPIRNPHGEVVAVIDATSWSERSRDLDPSVVLTVARAIEEVLRARAYAGAGGGLALVERLIERASGPAFLVEAPGRIARANAEARALIARRGTTDVLPPWRELLSVAGFTSPFDVPPDLSRTGHLAVEPITGLDGELLALLVLVGRPAARPTTSAGAASAFDAILGDDPALAQARERGRRLAASDLPVLLLAETGSGKELFARAIHDASRRANGPCIAVNCGAIQPDLLLSELFGHGPAAFTGAARGGRDGLVAAADGGTLFLDEVAELPVDAQVALLRVLEDGYYTRVGETVERQADIRIVAATCRDLPALVEEGEFRKDLFFRIGGAQVELPTLRARRDFETLLEALWDRVRLPDGTRPARLTHAARARLASHSWPGNVRELKSALEYAAVMANDAPAVDIEHLPPTLQDTTLPVDEVADTDDAPSHGALDDARRQSLVDALRESQGNVSAAARRLGVARSTVYRLARRYGLDQHDSGSLTGS